MAETSPNIDPPLQENNPIKPTVGKLSPSQSAQGPTRFCAYNQTRERFLSNQVEVSYLPPDLIAEFLKDFTPGSGVALWIAPFRELPLTIFSLPVDLVHLDQRCVVLDTVESFPIATSGTSGRLPASVLILPTQMIASAGIRAGDQIILCSPTVMDQRLNRLQYEKVHQDVISSAIQEESATFLKEVPMRVDRKNEPESNLLSTQNQVHQVPVAEGLLEGNASPAEASICQDSPSEPVLEQRQTIYSKKKSWWRRFLAGEPLDPRKAEREPIPGLVAYFFTGGAPIAHEVLDISANGLYVLTKERWYPDTVIRVTLSDQRDPSREISLTLHARAARSGADGVGLQFFLLEKKDLDRNNSLQENDPTLVVTKNQLEDFVRRFKGSLP
jgi:hypothetical protein